MSKEHKLSFEPLIPNEHTIQAMKEACQENLAAFTKIEDLIADLNA